MQEILLNVVLAVAILGGAFWFTHWFVNAMYRRCAACGTLNARRRDRCRICGTGWQTGGRPEPE